MYRQILVPLDGSPFAEQVLTHLPSILAPGGRVTLLRVLPPGDEEARGGGRQGALNDLERASKTLDRFGIRSQSRVTVGGVADEIHRVREMLHAELIAMTTHGRSGVERWVIGSVADRVLRGARVPVFLTRAPAQEPLQGIRHILVPLDGSELAQRALPEARGLATGGGAILTLMRVVEEESLTEFDQLLADVTGRPDPADRIAEAERYLGRVVNLLRMSGVAARVRVCRGRVAPAILSEAATAECDVVVMSTHGRTGIQRWMFGSVANQVLLDTACPLLLVRAAPAAAVRLGYGVGIVRPLGRPRPAP